MASSPPRSTLPAPACVDVLPVPDDFLPLHLCHIAIAPGPHLRLALLPAPFRVMAMYVYACAFFSSLNVHTQALHQHRSSPGPP
mmetsp:Transcript_10518/g.32376  ORF Transcript_10518/g.32376 Transcript_10518/m.32376 type:complete len:84 (+) Transcript_10518:1365-1616(+)